MSTEKTAEQLMDLIEKYIHLRPKLVLPEHVVQFKKKMQALKGNHDNPEDHTFVFRILILLAQSENPLMMSDLSTRLNVPLSTATRIVSWLVRGDMVERINDPNDRRVVRVGMSKNGRELYQTALAYNKQRVTKLLEDFTPEEQEQLLRLMTKLFDAFLKEK
jgi:DNA-binding MarR family transcriptional regulator